MAFVPDPERIYLSPPDVRGREKELLLDALESNWITPLGPHVDQFEAEMARYIGVGSAAALSSGTAALHLALLILGVSAGDSVVCSSLTFVASANAIRYAGADPIFVDSDESTWNMCPERLQEALECELHKGRLPKAIVAVDLYGHTCDYDRILEVAARYRVPVVEDAAEALGASYREKKAGTLGALGVFSFNGNKIITTSGGGMLVSDNEEWIAKARYLATQARQPVLHYEHQDVGYNYRLSNLLAAVGRAQLETLDERIDRRREVRAHYQRELEALSGLRFMPDPAYGSSNCWLTCVQIEEAEFGASRDAVIESLSAKKIEARPVWKPMHMQPVFEGAPCYGGAVAESLFNKGLCLPSGSSLLDDQVQLICETLASTGNQGGQR